MDQEEFMHLNTTYRSVDIIDYMGTDKTVVDSARLSYNKDDLFKEVIDEQDEKLIKYLAKHKHTSPFNHCFVSFKCQAPIFVARQLVKHEYLVWNEISRRYTVDEVRMLRVREWGEQSDNSKQGTGKPLKESLQGMCHDAYANAIHTAYNCYEALLRAGVSKEDARMVLPQSTMTQWYWSGSLGAFAKMCKLRLDPHAQHYTRYIAECISFYIKDIFPVSWKELMNDDKG